MLFVIPKTSLYQDSNVLGEGGITQIAIIMFVLAHPPSTNRPHCPLSANGTKIILPLERNYFLPSLVVPLFCKGHNTAKVREGDDYYYFNKRYIRQIKIEVNCASNSMDL